jgi:uncharacterized protein
VRTFFSDVPSASEKLLQSFAAVILTGGSSGIGKSFIELGSRLHPGLVFCNLSRRSPAKNISVTVPKNLNHFPCDLSRAAEIERVAVEVGEFLDRTVPTGRIMLINNSGFGTYGHFPKPNLGRQLEMIDVDVRAVVHLTGLLLPRLQARGGAIITVASTAAFQPTPYMVTYGAAKAFVLHWTLALNEELRGSGVRALAVCPGPVETEFAAIAGLQTKSVADWLTTPVAAVPAAAFRALAAGRSQVVPRWTNKASTFASSKIPKPLVARIAAKVIGHYRLKMVRP